MNVNTADPFCRSWLEAWTHNQPDELLSFYAANAFYRDPACGDGLIGHDALRAYFEELLAANPNWRWADLDVTPTPDGFVVKWKADIRTRHGMVTESGVDEVELEDGKITRNYVYYDRIHWAGGVN